MVMKLLNNIVSLKPHDHIVYLIGRLAEAELYSAFRLGLDIKVKVLWFEKGGNDTRKWIEVNVTVATKELNMHSLIPFINEGCTVQYDETVGFKLRKLYLYTYGDDDMSTM